jgi:hypothetical protein
VVKICEGPLRQAKARREERRQSYVSRSRSKTFPLRAMAKNAFLPAKLEAQSLGRTSQGETTS